MTPYETAERTVADLIGALARTAHALSGIRPVTATARRALEATRGAAQQAERVLEPLPRILLGAEPTTRALLEPVLAELRWVHALERDIQRIPSSGLPRDQRTALKRARTAAAAAGLQAKTLLVLLDDRLLLASLRLLALALNLLTARQILGERPGGKHE